MIEGIKPAVHNLLRPAAQFLLRMRIHPNALTLLGLLLLAMGAWFIGNGKWITAFWLVVAGSLMDIFDGLLAREGGLKTTFGAILDSTCDRLTEIIWTFGLVAFYVRTVPAGATNWGIYLSFLALTGSIMVSYVKARCEGAGIPCNGGILQRPERVIIICAGLVTGPYAMLWALGILAVMAYFTVGQRLVIAFSVSGRS